MPNDSFLDIDDINEANKERLLKIRETLAASVARNAQREDRKGMYLISLAIFTEFERLTRHILEPEITKN
jgi:hypothetical protein